MSRKKGVAPPRYDEAFKEGGIRLVTEQGRPSKEVAEELGIHHDSLRNWLKSVGGAGRQCGPLELGHKACAGTGIANSAIA